MYHSITIGDKNTWDDWHLISTSRPLVNPPPVKTNYVEIPGGNGILDLSTAMAGRPLYNNRTGSWEFYVENGFRDWSALYQGIMRYLHGQKLKVILEDDPDFYYEGRFAVNQWKSDPQRSSVVIDYNVGPYKLYTVGNDEWLWDPFNFETGVIRYYKNLTVSGSRRVRVIGEMNDTIPTIISSVSGMIVEYQGEMYTLSKGSNRIQQIVIHPGEQVLQFIGNGIISIEFTGGRL